MEKTCNECRRPLPLESFANSANSPDGLQYKCRECQAKRWAAYKAAKGDLLRAKQREYHAKPETKARKRAYGATDHMREYFREWRRKNRAKIYGYERRYIDRRKANGGRFTAKDWVTLQEVFGGKCLSCGATCDLVADHVIPVSKGGTNGMENRQLLCRSCNSRKSDGTTDFRPKE